MEKRVLAEYLGSKKPVTIPVGGPSISEKVLEIFNLKSDENIKFVVQVFDKEWGTNVDIQRDEDVPDKSEVYVHKMVMNEPARENAEIQIPVMPGTATPTSQEDMAEIDNLPRTPSTSYKRWPEKYIIPKHLFSTSLVKLLNQQMPLSWSFRKELKDHIVNDLQQYMGLIPNLLKLGEAAMSLVQEYPYLREEIGTGYEGWVKTFRERFKTVRTEVRNTSRDMGSSNKRSLELPDTGRKLKIAKKGELNWQPDNPEGEDESSITKHVEFLKRESCKTNKKLEVINLKMDITFPSRRRLINTNCSIQQLKDTYPCLFTTAQIQLEFHRLMNLELEQTFTDSMLTLSPSLLAFANKKKKNELVKAALQELSKTHGDLKQYSESVTALRLLPELIGDDSHLYFQQFTPGTTTTDMEKAIAKCDPTPVLLSDGSPHEKNTAYYLAVEKKIVVDDIPDFTAGVMILIGIYYVANITYPTRAASTFTFLQKKFLGINDDCKLLPKVNTLLRQLSHFK